jgi:hypothetical protein
MLTALTLAIAAIVVPPARTTEWMVGGLPSATMADVELGVWIL